METSWDSKAIARAALVVAVALLSVFMLWRLLPALAWAAVLAIATWPLRQWLVHRKWMGETAAAFLLTLFLAMVLVLPLIRIGIEAARDSTATVNWVMGYYNQAFPDPPGLVQHLPFAGEKTAGLWKKYLTGQKLTDLLASLGININTVVEHVNTSGMLGVTRVVGTEVASRLTILVFSLVTLFFFYRDGHGLMNQAQAILDRLFGPSGGHHGKNAVAAVRAAVNGLVLVGLAEGVLLGIAYRVAEIPYAAPLGLVTAVFSTLPLGAPLVFIGCALVLYFQGKLAAAIALAIFGSIVVVLADHVVRPMLIGRTTRLPFLGVLLGIVGGLETFHLLGLFLGPAIISVLVAMWREGAEAAPPG